MMVGYMENEISEVQKDLMDKNNMERDIRKDVRLKVRSTERQYGHTRGYFKTLLANSIVEAKK